MPDSTTLREPGRRARPRRTTYAVAAITLAAAAVAAVVAATGRGPDAAKPDAPTPPVAAQLPAPEAPTGSETLYLPQPTGYTDGVPTGYPHTLPGAVAAAYGYSRIASGLDVETTLQTVEAFVDPASGWFPRARGKLADGLIAQRRDLGLPTVGPVGSASLTVAPAGYQFLGAPGSDAPTVLTLNVLSAVAADGTRTSGVVVLRWPLRWAGEQWLVTGMYSAPQDAALAVTPSTTQAQAQGWQVARGG